MPANLLVRIPPDLAAKNVGYKLTAQTNAEDDLVADNCVPNEPLLPGQPGILIFLIICSWDRP